MRGLNVRSPREDHTGELLVVRETFHTIQGEGPRVGTPAFFVRLGGCNLACSFCDTDFDLYASTLRSVDHILAEARTKRTPLIVLTGGEPMRQRLWPFLHAAVREGFAVQIETSGSMAQDFFVTEEFERSEVEIVVSPKTPRLHPDFRAHAWKYVVEHDAPFDDHGIPMSRCQGGLEWKPLPYHEAESPADVFLQPCDHHDVVFNERALARTVAACREHGYRISLQTHKILNLP